MTATTYTRAHDPEKIVRRRGDRAVLGCDRDAVDTDLASAPLETSQRVPNVVVGRIDANLLACG